MKKYFAGSLQIRDEEKYYTDDFIKFYDEKNNELSIDDLSNWAIWINSPWSQVHERYKIVCNCESAYVEMDKNEPTWKCEYSIIGYDGVCAIVVGYGNTEVEALEECKKHFDYLQETYNKEDESF